MILKRTAVCLAALTLLMQGCGSSSGSKDDEVVIGAVLSLTGPASSLGIQEKDGIDVAVKKLNDAGGVQGKQVRVEVKDDQSTAQTAVVATRSLIQKDIRLIIGGSVAASCLAMRPLTQSAKVVQYCLSGLPMPKVEESPYYYAANPPTSSWQGDLVVQFAKEVGAKSIGCLRTDDQSGDLGESVIAASAEGANMPIRCETFAASDTSAVTQVAKLKVDRPGMIYIATGGQPAVVALSSIRQLGLNVPVYISASAASLQVAGLIKSALPKAGAYTSGAAIQVPNEMPDDYAGSTALKEFRSTYEASTGNKVDMFAAVAADVLTISANAVASAGSSADAVTRELEHSAVYRGLASDYDLSEDNHRGTQSQGIVTRYQPDGSFSLYKQFDEVPDFAARAGKFVN